MQFDQTFKKYNQEWFSWYRNWNFQIRYYKKKRSQIEAKKKKKGLFHFSFLHLSFSFTFLSLLMCVHVCDRTVKNVSLSLFYLTFSKFYSGC